MAGDTFEKEEDLTDDSIWIEAGSQDQGKQVESREKILSIADYVIPGHGGTFRVDRNK